MMESQQRHGAVFVGVFLMLCTLLTGRSVVERLFVADHTLTAPVYLSALAVVRWGLMGVGALLLALRPRNAVMGRLLMAAGSLVLFLLVSEMVLRFFYNPPRIVAGWKTNARPSQRNELGFRGHPIRYGPDDRVVLLVGDSQVEAWQSSYGWIPERRLEHYLADEGIPACVVTLGAAGYGQDQQLLAMREYYEQYRADLVAVWETPNNDVWNNLFPTHWPANGTPKPTFWLADGRLQGPSEYWGQPLDGHPIRWIRLLQRIRFRFNPRDEAWERILPPAYRPEPCGDSYTNDWQVFYDQDRADTFRHENLDTEKSHVAFSLTPRSERMKYGLELTHQLLLEMQRLAELHHGRFLVFRTVVPKEEPSGEVVHRLNGRCYRTSAQQYMENVKDMNEGLLSFDIPVTTPDPSVSPDDPHLNEHANDQVMKDLAAQLASLLQSWK